ncbi:ABC transporter substrate-binding protein [Nitratireductor kimnyeongensis]|uniref:ABC transporter substrate-binding protein n=1 Tax=Nitratireductor kimnyeongensis TaxID=430679 RepID=A0ABW0TC11_9HYPH|nr:sugar ABC transporter substrate-binding protein [Nitratireductor kimnyeongensis]QZZ36958.1 sugar ABC transporter substrate-binding protein [Nitratireductor kimnyeongensis]
MPGRTRNLLYATALAATALAAGSTTSMAEDEISFLVVDFEAPGMGDWWQLLVSTYEEKTGNKVVPRNTPASEYYEQLLIQAASGTGADILTVNPNNIGELLAAGQLMPLTEFFESSGVKEQIVEGGFDALTADGEIYALPITGRTLELIYNACYLKDAGFDRPPQTPQEFLDYATKLTVKDGSGRVTRYGANMVNANEDPTYEMLLMWSIANGGSFADADGNFTLDSEPVIAGLKQMKALYDAGVVPKGMTETDQRSLFATGGTAMTIDGQWQFPFIEKNNSENFDCYKSALHPWDGPGTGGVNMALAINAATSSPDAAKAFIETAASAEMQSTFSDHSPYIPYGVNALTDAQKEARPYLEPWIKSSGNAHPVAIPGHADQFNEIWPIVVDAVLLTLRDGKPAEESLAEAQAKLEDCCAK